MTSSTKAAGQFIAAPPEEDLPMGICNILKIGWRSDVISEICSRTDRQRDRQTKRQTHKRTHAHPSTPSPVREVIMPVMGWGGVCRWLHGGRSGLHLGGWRRPAGEEVQGHHDGSVQLDRHRARPPTHRRQPRSSFYTILPFPVHAEIARGRLTASKCPFSKSRNRRYSPNVA